MLEYDTFMHFLEGECTHEKGVNPYLSFRLVVQLTCISMMKMQTNNL